MDVKHQVLIDDNIGDSLKKLGFPYKAIGFTDSTGIIVDAETLHSCIDEIYIGHLEYWGNPLGDHFILDIQKRKDVEQQEAYMMLINKGYDDFFLIMELPLIIQFYIDILNNDEEYEIGRLMFARIQKEAEHNDVPYDKMAIIIKKLFHIKDDE